MAPRAEDDGAKPQQSTPAGSIPDNAKLKRFSDFLAPVRDGNVRRFTPDAIAIELSSATAAPSQTLLQEAVTAGGNTALHLAASFGHGEIAKLICARDLSILAQPKMARETPLHCAAKAGDAAVMEVLLGFMSEENATTVLRAPNKDGETALHEAVRGGHVDAARRLLAKDPGLAGVSDGCASPLYLAAASGNVQLVRALIEKLPCTDETPAASAGGPEGQTALHAAVLLQSTEIAQNLLKWGEKLATCVTEEKKTPLHYVASAGNIAMMKLLLHHDVSAAYWQDANGSYPIHIAAKMGNIRGVEALLNECPDCDELLDGRGQNFLHIAAVESRREIVRYVCHNERLVRMLNARDNSGNTPLHLAVENKNHNCVRLLIVQKKVQSGLMNKNYETPLDLAIQEMGLGFAYTLNSQVIILRYLAWTGALLSPRPLDRFVDNMRVSTDKEEEIKKYENITQNLLFISVLVATVSFAAIFTLPGGSVTDAGRYTGTPVFAKQYAFRAFLISNYLAFLCSLLATVWLIYAGSVNVETKIRGWYLRASIILVKLGTRSMAAAFALGLYVMLAPLSKQKSLLIFLPIVISILFGNPSDWEIFYLPSTIRRRVGITGLFRAQLSPFITKHVAKRMGANFMVVFLRRMVTILPLYMLIFAIAYI